ncbi:hypothetical protein, partial [Staphylococcus pseudintermedius]|uniref:hypothetical protein n=1 Tax=Staphylococcus pseudintermedius TaxID=283734 RepID=UPI001C92F476
VEGLSSKIASLSVRLAEFEASRAGTPTLPEDLGAAQVVEAEAADALAKRRTELADIERELELVQTRTRELGIAGAAQLERVKMDRDALACAEADLVAARSEHTDDYLSEQLESATEARGVEEARLAEANRALERADPHT